MRFTIILILFISISLLSAQSDYRIINTSNQREITLSDLGQELTGSQVIFFGEYHDDMTLHRLEIELLQELYQLDQQLAVSLEMFERDVQPVLDQYLSGEIKEAEFLENSRPWSNYVTAYRPLIEFAREKQFPVIAANIPRRYASLIHKNGLHALDSLSTTEQQFVAFEHIVLEDEYKSRFIETMQANMGHRPNSPMGKQMNFDLIYAAQCIKDDTMAESLQQFLTGFPGKRIIHFNGDFHSRKHLGTAQKFTMLMPEIKTTVIAPLILEDGKEYTKADLLEADYLILLTNE